MTKDDALDLLGQYADMDGFPDHLLDYQDHILEHTRDMPNRFPSEGSENKAMRWLGFVQGVLVMAGIFSLDEVKEHSRTRTVP